MKAVRNYGCITVLLLGAAGVIFSIVRRRWGSGNLIEESVENILMALAVTLGGLWLTIFPKIEIGFDTYVRISEAIFNNREQAEQRVRLQAFSVRVVGILWTLGGVLMLIISVQDLLVLFGIVTHP